VLAAQFADALRELGSTVPTSIATTAVEDEAFNLSHNDVAQRDVTQDAKWKILFLSRLEERKGVLTAVDTAKELMLRGHSVELTIVGDGPALSAVRKRLASDSGPRVEMVGYIRDTAKWQTIRSAHIFIFPTEYGEGMPIALLEAMACGLPIVCRPVAGIGDFFEDGRMGHGTLSTSPKDFASLVESVLSDATRARDIGEYNSRYAMSHFSSEAAAVALERVYADIHGM
jgi:glycosyltransferase involved in cell wall biosynthesis